MWNLDSSNFDASRFLISNKFLPKPDEVITKLKHLCIESREIVVSFTDKTMKKYILDYHFLAEVSNKHDLGLVLIVQPPIQSESKAESELYCQTALDRIEEINSLTTFKRKSIYMASVNPISR